MQNSFSLPILTAKNTRKRVRNTPDHQETHSTGNLGRRAGKEFLQVKAKGHLRENLGLNKVEGKRFGRVERQKALRETCA